MLEHYEQKIKRNESNNIFLLGYDENIQLFDTK